MNREVSKVNDFSGHRLYVGLDVHFKSWSVSIYSDEFELRTFSQPPVPDQLVSHLQKHYPGAEYVLAYEAGFSGFWIQREFALRGLQCLVVNPADIGTTDKDRKRKTDAIDSRKIAKGLRSNELSGIFVPDPVLEADRQVLRGRGRLIKDQTRIKNRIKAFLKLHQSSIGITTEKMRWGTNSIRRLQALELPQISNGQYLASLLGQLIFLQQEAKNIELNIKNLSQNERYRVNAELLRTIPGIALFNAMTILTEVGDINRFKRLEDLCSYCGLVPDTHSSGQTERIGDMTRRGNATIKKLLIESAWVAVRRDPALLLYYKQAKGNTNHNKVIVKVARKLLSRIRCILIQKIPYSKGVVQ